MSSQTSQGYYHAVCWHLAVNIILMLYKPLMAMNTRSTVIYFATNGSVPVEIRKMDSTREACDQSHSYVTTSEALEPRFEHKPSQARLEDSVEGAEKG